MKTSLQILLLAVLLTGCATQNPPKRYAWVTGLKKEKKARYEDLHAHPWPSVTTMLKKCHIRNYSIFAKEIQGRIYLFSYLEYTGRNFDADMKKMAADSETRRWWKQTDPCQLPLPEAAAKGKIWSDTKEVFHLN